MPSYKTHHREFNPPVVLKDSIKCFWYDKVSVGAQPSNFDVVPDGYAEIIFYFGSSCSLVINGNLQPLPSPFIIGLLNQPAIFNTTNCLEIIGIRCFPWSVFKLLGLPSGNNGVQRLEHTIGQLQSILNESVLAGNIEKAIAEVEQYFLNAQPITDNTMLLKAGSAMRNANGNLPVSEVANAANVTVRTLERNFKQSSGHTVKDVSGLIRFEQARNHLLLNPNANLAGLAHELGYTDQAHLSKEFKRYSGTTPSAFARKAKNG